jgi:hypothetical protein
MWRRVAGPKHMHRPFPRPSEQQQTPRSIGVSSDRGLAGPHASAVWEQQGRPTTPNIQETNKQEGDPAWGANAAPGCSVLAGK